MPDPVKPPLRRLPGRPRSGRSLTAAALLCCAVVYAGGFSDGPVSAVVTAVAWAGWFVAYFMLRAAVGEAADLPDDRLDERELALRNRSYVSAYRLLGAAVAVSLVVAIVDDAVGDLVVSWYNVLSALLLLAGFLPSAVVVGGQPHPEADAD